jgi:hypothetical protein
MDVPARTRSSPTLSPLLGVDIVYKPMELDNALSATRGSSVIDAKSVLVKT